MLRRLSLLASSALAAGALVSVLPLAAPSAQAATPSGKLVYIDGGNVWVSSPTGAGKVQVTTGGGWSDPSMSDNGRIAALRGDDLVVLRADGSKVAQFELPTLFIEGSCGTINETPPLEAQISPDGTKVVWSQLRLMSCNGHLETDARTAITNATGYQLRGLVLGHDADWVGNGRVVLDDNDTMRLMDVDHDGPKAHDWFDSYDLWGTYYDLNSVAVSRDGSRVAYLMDRYDDPELIIDHATTGDPRTGTSPGVPATTGECQAASGTPRPDSGPALDDLMFSPDGTALVHVEGDDVWTITGVDGPCDQRVFTKVLPGVTDVSWSGYTGTVSVDRTAPRAEIKSVGVKGRTATVRFTGSDAVTPTSALRFRCQIDSGTKRTCTSPQAFTRLKPGQHTVRVWATDRAGNRSAAASARFTVRR